MPLLLAATAVILFALGLYGLLRQPQLLRKILAINIMSSAVFLLLGVIARALPGTSPDPVPHAMVLTGLVVSVSATGFFLVLCNRIQATTGKDTLKDPDEA